ncbi:YceI family protein [Pseudoroseomonas cervicalis]|uniref:YceI family protein n=1 Tax=Teichococcus cervicalis TaxID=204525 RepID=UPI0022F1B4DF|nr:YceI family protein [Pseudoroseomonas cervicalis]WBV43150.1 YceI family protein [Pseudoroseomonas cervicalis]
MAQPSPPRPAFLPATPPPLARRGLLAGLLALPALARPRAARAAIPFVFDQRHATVEFTVTALGLFDITGHFARFEGSLQLEREQPERSLLAVTLDMSGAEVAVPQGTALLHSADFFDVAHYPRARFESQGGRALGADRYALQGQLAMRGTAQPLLLEAALQDRRRDAKGESVGLVASGALSRAAFGMVADRATLSDTVRLTVRMRLAVPG